MISSPDPNRIFEQNKFVINTEIPRLLSKMSEVQPVVASPEAANNQAGIPVVKGKQVQRLKCSDLLKKYTGILYDE